MLSIEEMMLFGTNDVQEKEFTENHDSKKFKRNTCHIDHARWICLGGRVLILTLF